MTMMSRRFRGFFPVVVDVETAGFNAATDALLEIAAVSLQFDDQGYLRPANRWHYHIAPFEGANIEQSSIEFNGIDPFNPLRGAVSERDALKEIFTGVRAEQKEAECQRSVLVGHNPGFDMGFLLAASDRIKAKRNPFHPFTTFDTATLAGLALGQTVLAKACEVANIGFDNEQAHSALYDTEKTAELFCFIVNRWKKLGGWPLGD
ncbi:ribonuclease T [Aliikangiella marina]|uniref:Ribonuclease T n=2 Tax=Aliikangiella marina TaxID=1712262 RepID=A0A545TDK5_9GAMM|nr:ribonuclease T [Aliikangiella marina]